MISYNCCGLFKNFKETLSANEPASLFLSEASLQETALCKNYPGLS